MFAQYTANLSRHVAAADPDLSTPSGNTDPAASQLSSKTAASVKDKAAAPAHDPTKLAKLFDLLKKYEDNFSKHLKILLDTLNYLAATETVVFLSLCARLSTAGVGSGLEADVLGVDAFS